MAKLEYDYTNLCASVVGPDRGVTDAERDELAEELARATDRLHDFRQAHDVTFLDLPELDIEPIEARAQQDRASYSDMLVLGIGGSSLGTRAVYRALAERPARRGEDGARRLHFVENVDPTTLADVVAGLDWDKTVVNVVTKSGNTIETMSSFFFVRRLLEERLGEEEAKRRIVATTDPSKGALRSIVSDEGLASLDVPPGVGGRFSVLSAVGLYPLAFAGVPIASLLAGASAARSTALGAPPDESPAVCFARDQILLYRKGVDDVVFMPYSDPLGPTAAWFVQLWAESLGKIHSGGEGERRAVGPTPIPAIGVTDQHSQLQLFMEGPANKSVVFVEVMDHGETIRVPALEGGCPSLSHLGSKTMGEILAAELAGTRAGLAEAKRPTATFRLPALKPASIGALLMTLEIATALAGFLLEIDPFNQPGVELGKRYAHGLLGRSKESHYADRLRDVDAKAARRTADC